MQPQRHSSNLCVSVSLWLSCICFSFLLAACGSGTESGRIFGDTGHPENWASHLTIGRDHFHGTVIKSVRSGSNGAILFVKHCAPCHGDNGTGRIGPDIRGVPASLITFAVNIPIMLGHSVLSPDEIQEIADYLAALNNNQQPLTGVIDASICKQCHGDNLDGGIARVSCFSCHNGPEGAVGHPAGWLSSKEDLLHFHGRYGKDFVGGCTACHGVDLRGFLGPSCFVCHNGTIAPFLELPPLGQ